MMRSLLLPLYHKLQDPCNATSRPPWVTSIVVASKCSCNSTNGAESTWRLPVHHPVRRFSPVRPSVLRTESVGVVPGGGVSRVDGHSAATLGEDNHVDVLT